MKISVFISHTFAKYVLVAMGFLTLGLAALSLTFELLNFLVQASGDGQAQLFDLDADQNIPTWYSSSMLLICAILLAGVATAARGIHILYWGGLAVGFLYLSADEAASIHEKVRPVLSSLLHAGEFTNYVWVVLYGPFVLILALAYVRFLRDLPTDTRRLFLAAGSLYIGGVLGMEVVGGLYATFYGNSNLAYTLLTHIEELLEMFGVIVFVYSLLLHTSFYVQKLEIGAKVEG